LQQEETHENFVSVLESWYGTCGIEDAQKELELKDILHQDAVMIMNDVAVMTMSIPN